MNVVESKRTERIERSLPREPLPGFSIPTIAYPIVGLLMEAHMLAWLPLGLLLEAEQRIRGVEND